MIELKRQAIIHVLRSINIDKPILFPFSEEEIKQIFFNEVTDTNGTYYVFYHSLLIFQEKINFSNIPLDNVNISGKDLSKAYGLKINPQTIHNKSLHNTTLSQNAEIVNNNINQIDLFEGVNVKGTKFNNCKNVRINPQTIFEKSLFESQLEGVDFSGFSFDGTDIRYANFTGSNGAKMDLNKLEIYRETILTDVEITDLPEEPARTNVKNCINYNNLLEKKAQYETDFYNLIKAQLPEPVIEEKKSMEEAPSPTYKKKKKFISFISSE